MDRSVALTLVAIATVIAIVTADTEVHMNNDYSDDPCFDYLLNLYLKERDAHVSQAT